MHLYRIREFLISAAVLLSIWALAPGAARADGFALGVKAGTLGLGAEGTFSLTSSVNARLGINSYTYTLNENYDDIDYRAELDFSTSSLIFDWHSFGGSFRLSAGIVGNNNEFGLTATPTANKTIGNASYTPAQIGTLSGVVSFKSSAPYAGVGWGNAVAKNKGLGFTADVGVLFQGSPQVTLSNNGALSGDPTFQADLRREEEEIERDIENFKAYPVLSLGMTYRF